MRIFLTALFLGACSLYAFAQGSNQQIDLDGARAVRIYAAFSSVEVITGGTNTLNVAHEVVLDGADRSDLRKLSVEREGETLVIRELKPTAKLLRSHISPKSASEHFTHGQNGRGSQINGVQVDATLKVTVPAGIRVMVETEYGSIRVEDTPGLVSARAKYGAVDVVFSTGVPVPALELYSNYGAVDVTIPTGRSLNLDLTTEFGDLLTDLDIEMDATASKEGDFYQHVVGQIGSGGVTLSCEAPYGNVYLREGE